MATSVGAGFAARVTCSLVFVSGQDPERVLEEAQGHSGQYVVVVPSARLVVVRLGLSYPNDGDDGTHALVAELLAQPPARQLAP